MKFFKSWRMGDYFRQFSIVTAGVVVTFTGSALISNWATNREINSTIGLIINELEGNNRDLAVFIEKHQQDRVIAGYLVGSDFDVSSIAQDTLRKYQPFISQLSDFQYSADALDVLKSSSLMQKISDKEMLLNLIETYQGFQGVQGAVAEYYDVKRSVILPTALGNDNTHSGDIYKSYQSSLSTIQMRNFCIITTGFFNEDYLQGQIDKTDVLISRLRGTL